MVFALCCPRRKRYNFECDICRAKFQDEKDVGYHKKYYHYVPDEKSKLMAR